MNPMPILLGLVMAAAGPVSPIELTFPSGTKTSTVTGEIIGSAPQDYQLEGKQGQTIAVSLLAESRNLRFDVMLVKDGSASLIGRMSRGGTWSGRLPADGQYTVRVSQVRSGKDDADSEPADFKLTLTFSE